MKKRVAIYVDEKVWLGIRKRALELGKSAGDYLVSMHLAVKVDEVKSMKMANGSTIEFSESEKPVESEGLDYDPIEISDAEKRIIKDEYARYFKQVEKSVSPKKVIKTVDDIPQTFRSYSKAEQLGKKK